MDFDEYQRLASRTALFNEPGKIYALMYLGMGLAGESGEVVEKVKHIIRDSKGEVFEEKREGVKKEMGDVLWYLSQLARELDISFNEVAELNIKKLADRAARNVIKSEGDIR